MDSLTRIEIATWVFLAAGVMGSIALLARRLAIGVAAKPREFLVLWVCCLAYWALAAWLTANRPEGSVTVITLVLSVPFAYGLWRYISRKRRISTDDSNT
jgi:hypothetical protein